MFVEQQMVVSKMRTGHVPMEILGFDVQRESVGEERCQSSADVLAGALPKTRRRRERCHASRLRIVRIHFHRLLRGAHTTRSTSSANFRSRAFAASKSGGLSLITIREDGKS